MAITQPAHGRWLVRCLVAALLLLAVGTVAPAQDRFGSRVIRGQSPIGNYYRYPQRYPQSVQSGRPLLFADASPPWIKASQDLEAPPQTFNAEPTNTMNQEPYDPGVPQPFSGGAPEIVNPILPWGFMNSPPIWQPYAAVQGNIGNDRSMGLGQLMIPLYQDGQSLIFADVRGRFADNSSTEGNFGLAMRTMVDPTWIFGLYGFYDYTRTANDNSFNQATFGMEALSVRYEARVNGYFPESGAKRANKITTAEFDSGTIFVRGGFERAYYGVDAEVGALLSEGYAGNVELRGFVGGYYFDTSDSRFPTVAGPKGRLELRAYDVPWFGPESRLTFGVELQHDSVRDTQVAGIARLEIPLGFFSGARRLNRLERRMLDRIVRDDDIITVAQRSPREVGRDSLTGLLLNNVKLVDASTPDVNAAVAAAYAVPTSGPPALNPSTVVVDGRLGPIDSSGIEVQPGQVFRGSGFQVIGSNDPGAMTTFGTRPTIRNDGVYDATVILSNHATVADLDLTGGLVGIYGDTLTGARVSGNKVSGALYGIGITNMGTGSTVSGNTATGNYIGIGIENMGAGSTVSGNTATGNYIGIGITNMGAGSTVIGNTANFNDDAGIAIFNMAADSTISQNTADNNLDGIRIDSMVGGTLSENTAHNNGNIGIYILDMAGGTVSGNMANNNTVFGFAFGNISTGSMVIGNFANNNAVGGYRFDSEIFGTVTGNWATANGFSSNTIANDPDANGFALIGPNSGVFTNNIATGNARNGFAAEADVDFINSATGTFSFNTANQNGGQGYRVDNTAGGPAEMNTGSFNALGVDIFP